MVWLNDVYVLVLGPSRGEKFFFITLLLYLSLLLLLKWPFILNYKEIILIDKYIRKQARGGGGGSRGLDEPPLGRKYWGNEKQITLGNSENWLLYFSCSLDYFLVNIIRKTGHMVSQHPISTMRRLNNYMRCTMGESRLPCLALMHINYDLPVDMEDLSQRTLILFFF